METNVIYNEDCIGEKGMCRLPDNSIDMILADLPYGTTQNKWDSVIPLDKLWKQYKRVIKENGAIVLTASSNFTPKLKMSNLSWFRYEWIWEKDRASGFLNANRMPLRAHENIVVFYKKMPTYNPQKTKGHKPSNRNGIKHKDTTNYRNFEHKIKGGQTDRYPRSVIKFNVVNTQSAEGYLHPTQKPVDLFEYLIKTYTNKNEIVLDNVMGSGTTAIACLKTDRKFIGFEREVEYYNIALKRIGKFDKSYYDELPEEEKPKQKQLF